VRDVIIIGGGPGGFDTAIEAKKNGLDVLLVEKGSLGGTCLNWGCIPTKALFHNAQRIKEVSSMDVFGIENTSYNINYDKIKQRKEEIVANQIKNIEFTIRKMGIDYIEGIATILDKNTVEVNGEKHKTNKIIIATGSRPKVIPFEGYNEPFIKTSKDLLELDTFPTNMVIIGAGVIGCEMASIFNQLGAEVTLVEFQPEILPALDKDIKKRARNLFKRQGINIITGAKVVKATSNSDIKVVSYESKGKIKEIETSYVLIAAGRVPHFGGLDLDKLGVEYDKNGIHVDEFCQTNVDSIYAIGDVNGQNMLAHKATYDGYQAIAHIQNKKRNIRFDLVPSVVFTFPVIATVGKNESDLEKDTYYTTKALFKSNAKAQCLDETDGFVKCIFDNDNTLIGAHIIGAHAADLIHELTVSMYAKLSKDALKDMIHAHPTISEVVAEAFKE
jgi:dihydrolipoamide dehydrogenase